MEVLVYDGSGDSSGGNNNNTLVNGSCGIWDTDDNGIPSGHDGVILDNYYAASCATGIFGNLNTYTRSDGETWSEWDCFGENGGTRAIHEPANNEAFGCDGYHF